jgi:hypothetical protein
MKNTWIALGAALLLGVGVFVGQVTAQDEGGGAGGGMMMPAWTKLTKEHGDMKKMVGTWDVVTKWNFGGMPVEDTGVFETKALWGGRFVESHYEGTMMKMPMEGRHLIGFDTIDKRYVSVWLDSMSPLMGIGHGVETDGVIVLKSRGPDMTNPGKKRDGLSKLTWKDDDTYELAFFSVTDDGKEAPMGTMTYSRRK